MSSTKRAGRTAGAILLAALIPGAIWLSSPLRADDPPATLATQARDILAKDCTPCHDATHHRAKINVTSRASLVNSGAVIPKDSANSKLVKVIAGGIMPPPQSGKKVSDDDLTTLKKWIDAGAPDWAATTP